jgi:RNA polymerase sigma-70 factor, ECF subfamily
MPLSNEDFIQQLTSAQQPLFGYILSLFPDRTAVNDILQNVNMAAWKRRDDFQPGSDFFAWTARIAYFHVLSHRKKLSRDRLTFNDTVLDYLADRQVERSEIAVKRSLALKRCLEKLPDSSRQLIRLRYSTNQSVQMIAEGLGKTSNAISQTLFRIRDTLTKCIERTMQQESLP